MEIIETQIPDVKIIKPKVYQDARGYFFELFNKRMLEKADIGMDFVQDNISCSKRGVLRGLHYQTQHVQGKLVTVTKGDVFDVAVDLRRSSPYFGKYVGVYLSGIDHQALWIPPGFGHGFLVLSEQADFFYKVTDYYHPESERTIKWNDPSIGIEWPLSRDLQPILSDKDQKGFLLNQAEVYP